MNRSGNTIRVFIALDISSAAKEALAQTVSRLQLAIPDGVRWVDPMGIHLTLKFLGSIDSSLVDGVLTGMQQASQDFRGQKFLLKLSGLGLFPRKSWEPAQPVLDGVEPLRAARTRVVSGARFQHT